MKRPDVGVLIVDFVRSNLPHAHNILVDLVGCQVTLMHADAIALPFTVDTSFQGFDGVWTVQTFQHISAFDKAVLEAYRVLKGRRRLFANYSLNMQPHIRSIKRMLGKDYPISDWVDGKFWLARPLPEKKLKIEEIFGNAVTERWSEILYSPELHFTAPGKEGSWLGKLDDLLSNNRAILRWLARQYSFHCQKS
jgi:ubiquinone/menaquinone biosynthesis C-methylase UbiE